MHCGTPLPAGSRRDRCYCNNKCRAWASIARREAAAPPAERWQHPALGSDNPTLRAAAAHAQHLSQAHGWNRSTLRLVLDGLTVMLDGHLAGERVTLTEVRTRTPRHASTPRVAEVLTDLGLLDDDTTPAIRSWIDRRTGELPAGFVDAVRAWLLVLLDGDKRTRPRSQFTIYVYFATARPFLEQWAANRSHLREITSNDVTDVLDPLRGWHRRTAIAALRSLFRFAKKRGLAFANPTTRLRAENVESSMLPMTDAEVQAVTQIAVNPPQRLIIALAAIHAARPASIRNLMLDDLDRPNRRITLAGHTQRPRRADPPRTANLARPPPRHLAAHTQPARPDLAENRLGSRADQQGLLRMEPAAARRSPRARARGPDPSRGLDHRARPAAPGHGLQPVSHHRKPIRGHRPEPARRPARPRRRAVAIRHHQAPTNSRTSPGLKRKHP